MKLFGYARVSSTSQEDNTSLQEQQERIQFYCAAMGHQLLETRSEIASGSNMKRPVLQSLIDDLPQADGLIVLKLDRLSRSVLDTVRLIADLNEQEKNLVAVEQQLDTSSSAGRLFVNIMASFSEYERELINNRTQGGRKYKASKGGYAYGKPRFGMQSVNKELVENEEEQRVIKVIKNHRRSGKSFYEIAKYLNANGFETKQGKRWHDTSVKNVLVSVKNNGTSQIS
jgi:site-specific DNA recombinase